MREEERELEQEINKQGKSKGKVDKEEGRKKD